MAGNTPAPSASNGKDPERTLDKTERFELTLEGSPVKITGATVEVKPASGSTLARVSITGSYQQLFGPTFTATFTVSVDAKAQGTAACDSKARFADYWFKDTDGTIRGLGTSFNGGGCTMTVLGNDADGFTSGTATGTVGGSKTKSFSVRWGKSLPKG